MGSRLTVLLLLAVLSAFAFSCGGFESEAPLTAGYPAEVSRFVDYLEVATTPAAEAIYVWPGGDDNNGGSLESPVKTLSRASEIAAASSRPIFAGAGVYRENIDLYTSLYGGFNHDGWRRNPSLYPTVVSALAADRPTINIVCGIDVLRKIEQWTGVMIYECPPQVVAGVTVYGPRGGEAVSNAIFVNNRSFSLFNSRVIGGSASELAAGVFKRFDGDILVERSTITGGRSGRTSAGILIGGPARAVVRNTEVDGGISDHRAFGVLVMAANSIYLSGNIITGGEGRGRNDDDGSAGVFIMDSPLAVLEHNRIFGGGGAASEIVEGVDIYDSRAWLIDNEIDATGAGENRASFGVSLLGSAYLFGNKIRGGKGVWQSGAIYFNQPFWKSHTSILFEQNIIEPAANGCGLYWQANKRCQTIEDGLNFSENDQRIVGVGNRPQPFQK